MSFHHRIRIIYSKELTDILRDRRTLIAMILVPIILYPLLLLGSIQAVSYQAASLEQESLIIGVINDQHRMMLSELIHYDTLELQKLGDALGSDTKEADQIPVPLEHAQIVVFEQRKDLEQSIQNRQVYVGVIFDRDSLTESTDYVSQIHVELPADLEEVRSAHAWDRVKAMIARTQKRWEIERLDREGLPRSFVEPFTVETLDLSSPPSILGQILPLILVLMTITGAIYPAIDLTAGERERGTLESLMVTPVPVIDLIVGKFLVVTTVAIMGATLNLASVSATVYFGGFDKVISQTGGSIPFATMGLILLSLIPFAVLMSAVMIAVCSYARTFKEAQNYVTPVILAVLIPGGIAALPATRLEGVMLVMPVGNMVLLSRDYLLGAEVLTSQLAMVMISTTLYAAAAVGIAATIFGKETVVFADAGSFRNVFNRSLIRPSKTPSVAMSLLIVALLFPTWFYIQSSMSPAVGENASDLLYRTGYLLPIMFVIVPVMILLYWKVDVRQSFGLRFPRSRYWFASILIGLSAWVPARELGILQQGLFDLPPLAIESSEMMYETLLSLPMGIMLLLIAVIPAIGEELLFRGFLLHGLRTSIRKWPAIIVSAIIFGIFHFFLFKFIVTASLGVLLGYLCWQSRSIIPAIIAHMLHNTIVAMSIYPKFTERLGIDSSAMDDSHLPAHILIIAGMMFVIGLLLIKRPGLMFRQSSTVAMANQHTTY